MASIDKRPDGRYRARWREYPGGPQKTRHFDRKGDADRFLDAVRGDIAHGVYIDPAGGKTLFRDYPFGVVHGGARSLVRPTLVSVTLRGTGPRHTRGVATTQPLTPRVATTADALDVARLLDDFNREYGDPTPGRAVLKERLVRLLAGREVIVLLAGDPPVALAVLTLRPNVWYDGLVCLLDELYVEPGMRRRGCGSSLLKATEVVARERGAELMEINVDGEDVDARRFYERHGYACMAPGEPEPDLYYSRDLH